MANIILTLSTQVQFQAEETRIIKAHRCMATCFMILIPEKFNMSQRQSGFRESTEFNWHIKNVFGINFQKNAIQGKY